MNNAEVLSLLSEILGSLLGADSLELTMETRRADVPGWDSFNYVNFIVAAEQEFRVKFALAEIESFESVGAIVERIKQLTAR